MYGTIAKVGLSGASSFVDARSIFMAVIKVILPSGLLRLCITGNPSTRRRRGAEWGEEKEEEQEVSRLIFRGGARRRRCRIAVDLGSSVRVHRRNSFVPSHSSLRPPLSPVDRDPLVRRLLREGTRPLFSQPGFLAADRALNI